jgi:hypothetical protein
VSNKPRLWLMVFIVLSWSMTALLDVKLYGARTQMRKETARLEAIDTPRRAYEIRKDCD